MSMKRILRTAVLLLLICGCLLALLACGNDGFYDPIKSSSRDRRVIAELGEEEVKYELFRYFFLSRIDEYDGGDRSLWSSDPALWEEAEADVINQICEIYAVFRVCRDWGIDPEGENIQNAVNISIAMDIDGGILSDGTMVSGYGSVDAYKAALAEYHCTDAVRRLLYRYKACLEALDSFIVDNHVKGQLSITDADLVTFANGDNCVHVNRVFVSYESFLNNRDAALEHAERLHGALLNADGRYDVMVEKVFSQALSSVNTDPEAGIWYGRLSTSERDYPDYYKTIFSIREGEISDIIEEWDGYYIVYGMDRTIDLNDILTKNTLTSLYLEEMYWDDIREATEAYAAAITYTKHYEDITLDGLMEAD